MANFFDYMFGNLSDIATEKSQNRRQRLGVPEDIGDRKAVHAERYANNQINQIDIQSTMNILTDEYFKNFTKGAKFPSHLKMYLDAHKRQGYEVARCGSVMNSRRQMIEDNKFTNNHYSEEREISKEGIDILSICTAYDEFLAWQKREENERVIDHRKSYLKAKAKAAKEEEIKEINGRAADIKKATRHEKHEEFKRNSLDPSDRDGLDDITDGIKKIFKFW